jgi:hypothetical protein
MQDNQENEDQEPQSLEDLGLIHPLFEGLEILAPSHAAPPLGSEVREATAPPYHGKRRKEENAGRKEEE